MDGIEATRRLPRQRLLTLTTFRLDEYIIDALRAGASGFLLKDAPTDEIVQAARAVAAGDAVRTPQSHGSSSTRSPPSRARPTNSPRSPSASNRCCACRGRPHQSHRQDPRVCNLLGKLGLGDRVQPVIYAYETGLIAPGER